MTLIWPQTAVHYYQDRGIRPPLLGLRLKDCFACSTKAGFIADDIADNLLVKSAKYGGVSKGDIVGGNCIHPNCLEASLGRSLANMNIAAVSGQWTAS